MRSRNSLKRQRRKYRENQRTRERRLRIKELNKTGTELELIEKPSFSTEEQSRIWDKLLADLRRQGVRKTEPGTLLFFVLAQAELLDAREALKAVRDAKAGLKDAEERADTALGQLKWRNGNDPEKNAQLDRIHRRAMSDLRIIDGGEVSAEETQKKEPKE